MRDIKRLYRSAFPKAERAPFFRLKSRAEKQKAEFFVAYDNGLFVGFVYVVLWHGLVYLFYLAINENSRGKGYGSSVLNVISALYNGKKIFVATESIDKSAPNYEQRLLRHEFYLKNGFVDLKGHIKEATETYSIMGKGGQITAEEYESLVSVWLGPVMRKFISMKMTD